MRTTGQRLQNMIRVNKSGGMDENNWPKTPKCEKSHEKTVNFVNSQHNLYRDIMLLIIHLHYH